MSSYTCNASRDTTSSIDFTCVPVLICCTAIFRNCSMRFHLSPQEASGEQITQSWKDAHLYCKNVVLDTTAELGKGRRDSHVDGFHNKVMRKTAVKRRGEESRNCSICMTHHSATSFGCHCTTGIVCEQSQSTWICSLCGMHGLLD